MFFRFGWMSFLIPYRLYFVDLEKTSGVPASPCGHTSSQCAIRIASMSFLQDAPGFAELRRSPYEEGELAEPLSDPPSSLSDLAQRAGLGRIGALIRPFFDAGWNAVGQF